MATATTKPKPVVETNGDTPPEPPPLYGDTPTFTYTPRDGGEPIVFPAHSTILGEVNGLKYLEFLWEMDKRDLGPADQLFWYLKRSGATEDMQRRLVRLDNDDRDNFFRAWINAGAQPPPAELPPES